MTTHPIRDDDDRPVEAEWPSPTSLDVPVWVLACVRLLPPEGRGSNVDKVLTVAAALSADRVKTSAEERVPLTRDTIGKVAGYSGKQAGKKAGWIVDYLIEIGFLRIYRRYQAESGHRAGDRLTVHPQGRPNYVGPRSYAELYQALTGSPWTWDDMFSQALGSHPGTLADSPRFRGGNLGVETAGQALGSESGTLADSPRFRGGNLGVETAGQALGSESGTFLEGSFASEGSEAKLPSEASERGAASLRAAGDATLDARLRELVRDAPWAAMGHTIREGELDELVPVITAAMSERELSLVSVQERLDVAVANLTSPSPAGRIRYVVGAFTTHLASSLPSKQRPLPDVNTPRKRPESVSRGPKPSSGTRGRPKGGSGTQRRSQGRNDVEGGLSGPVEPASPEEGAEVLANLRQLRAERTRREARDRSVS